MAKYVNSGLVPSIRGSVGDVVFSYWRGIPTIKKKQKGRRRRATKASKKTNEIFSEVSSSWKKVNFKEEALWEEYAKKYTNPKGGERDGLVSRIGGKMTGRNAYISLNTLLVSCGFGVIRKPPLSNISKPPLAMADLIDRGEYQDEVKFNVWLPGFYDKECVAQIWVQLRAAGGYGYIHSIVPVSVSKTEVVIDRAKARSKKGVVEKNFKESGDCKLCLQMRTVAENGEFSMAGPIYLIRVKSSKEHERRTGLKTLGRLLSPLKKSLMSPFDFTTKSQV